MNSQCIKIVVKVGFWERKTIGQHTGSIKLLEQHQSWVHMSPIDGLIILKFWYPFSLSQFLLEMMPTHNVANYLPSIQLNKLTRPPFDSLGSVAEKILHHHFSRLWVLFQTTVFQVTMWLIKLNQTWFRMIIVAKTGLCQLIHNRLNSFWCLAGINRVEFFWK